MRAILVGVIIWLWAHSALSNGILDRAYEQYSQRDFTREGIKSAANAHYNYDRMKMRLGNVMGEYARARSLQAMVFIIRADPSSRKFYTNQGFGEANSAYLSFQNKYGREPFSSPELNEQGKKIYADLLYWAAEISFEWIREQGSSMSSEKQKLVKNMERVIANGFGCLNAGGAFRLIGVYESSRALQMFEKAYQCAPWSGESALALAAELKRQGQQERAVGILRNFLSKAPVDWSLELIPENTRDQKVALEWLATWGIRALPEAIPGEYVVQLRPRSGLMGFRGGLATQKLARRLGGEIKSWVNDQILVLKRPVIETQDAVTNHLLSDVLVQRVEPNFVYRKSNPNDPLLGQQWSVINTGQADPRGQVGYRGIDANLLEAWKLSTGSSEVLVAVIDTGIDVHHPDLAPNIWVNSKEAGGVSGVDDDQNGFVDDIYGWDFVRNQPLTGDDEGHGTHCAGVIGAVGNNGIGVAGVNWNVKMMGIKFLDSNGGGSLELALKAVQYATLMKVHITSNSWGGGGFSEILRDAIKASGDQGILFVGAAGNNGENMDVSPEYPASYPVDSIVSVAALTNQGRLANFSNYGEQSVDLAAPGQNILSTIPGGKYESYSGTSMATPYVAGVAALLLSREKLSVEQLKSRLIKTAAPMSYLKGRVLSGGRLDAAAALTGIKKNEDPYDPNQWQSRMLGLATAHPYELSSHLEYELQQPGATFLAAHFSKFSIEPHYDRVFFLDSQKRLLGTWTGAHAGEYSPLVSGEKMYIRFSSDSHIQDYGFELDEVSYR